MDQAREDALADTAFPKEHWPQIAGTNPLKRLNGEIKRRSDLEFGHFMPRNKPYQSRC